MISKNKNNWIHEITVHEENKRLLRLKVYCKTADKLTSCGVANKKICDPLSKLLLTTDYNGYNQPQHKYGRFLFSSNGFVDSRIEVSIYND